MSVDPTGHASSIWSRVTSALTSTPSADLSGSPATDKTSSQKPAKPGQAAQPAPFQQLSSDLSSVLFQWQQHASLTPANQAGGRSPYAPEAGQPNTPPGAGMSQVA